MDRAVEKESFNLSLGLNPERMKDWSHRTLLPLTEPAGSSGKGQGWRPVGKGYTLDPAMLEAVSIDC